MADKHLPCTGPWIINQSSFSLTTSLFCYTNLICSMFLESIWAGLLVHLDSKKIKLALSFIK